MCRGAGTYLPLKGIWQVLNVLSADCLRLSEVLINQDSIVQQGIPYIRLGMEKIMQKRCKKHRRRIKLFY